MRLLACDANGDGRLVLALLLALGLHTALLFIPADWRSFRFPTPHRFEVRLLPPVAPPAELESALLPVQPALLTPLEAAAEVKPVLPVAPLQPVVAIQPAPKPVAPARPPVMAKPAPAPRVAARPVAPPKPAQPTKPDERPAKPRTVPPPAPKSVTPTVAAASNQISPRPERSGNRGAAPAAGAPPPRLDSAALLGQVASLEAQTQRQAAAGVRSKRVNPSDTQSPEGFYIAAWVRKVEQIGEMNFPSIARTLNLTAGPVLDVTLRADGSLQEVRVVRSSGHPELDRAAQQIVRLGVPYAQFPPALRQRYDLLQISRPWRFDPGGRVQAH